MRSQHIVLIPRTNIQDGHPISTKITVPPDGSKDYLIKAMLYLYPYRYRRSTSITFSSDTHSHVAFSNAGTDSSPTTSATQKVVGGDGTTATNIWVTTESGAASENVNTGNPQNNAIAEGDLPVQVVVTIDGTQIEDPKDATEEGETLISKDVTQYLTPGTHTIQVQIGTGGGEVGAIEVHLYLVW